LSKESGAEKLTGRADLKAMLQQATPGTQQGKN